MLDPNFDPFPVLETERLVLYQLTFADTEGIFQLRGNPVAMRYIGKPVLEHLSEAEVLIRHYQDQLHSANGITWGIRLKNLNEPLVGIIGFHRLEKQNYRAEIGYMIHPDYWGKGMMSEAIQIVLKYGFESMGLHSVEARINPDNEQSANILNRNGFVKEAYLKESYCFEGHFYDSEIYSLLVSDK
ncbi:MAG TPA: GNAT family N-acetyltransferase [Dyadobacter sp.]|jgi:ribosomal-protein-alanine N-acetyltransferase|nr:GNAT family N-acetyltransferase [Dyadobacter sp.]